MQNKRGQELSIGTLVLIVLGIIILVLLILGFSMGWSNLWEKINIFGGGTTLEAVAERCKLVQSNSNVGYCQTFMEVTDGGVKKYINCDYRKIKQGIDNPVICSTDAVKDECKDLLLGKFSKSYADESAFRTNFAKDCSANTFVVNDEQCNSAEYCTSPSWLVFDKTSNQLKLKTS